MFLTYNCNEWNAVKIELLVITTKVQPICKNLNGDHSTYPRFFFIELRPTDNSGKTHKYQKK